MSIADKLTYLDTTKQLLKTEINKINNVLDDNSTFRSYPQELFNGYLDVLNNGTDTLWNNLEKVSASGEEATLENVETAPMKMVLNSNTSQETTTGKNLFTGLIKNVRLDPNNGEEFSGSTGATTDFIPVNINSNISYYLSGLVDTIRSFTCAYNSNKEFLGRTSAQTVSEKALTVGSFTAGTPTGTGDIAYIRITQYIQGEGTIDIIDGAKTQLEQGSTATSYEPYTGGIPSPNPDYPQEVKVVKGENVVSVSGKNLAKIENGTFTDDANLTITISDGVITLNGSTSANYLWLNLTKRDYKYGTPNTSNKPTWFIGTLIKAEEYIGSSTNNVGTLSVCLKDGTIKGFNSIPNDVDISSICLYIATSGTTFNDTKFSIQIEQGSTATPYVPYSKTDYPIDLTQVGNLFDKDNVNVLNCYIDATAKSLRGALADRTIWIEVEHNTTYQVTKMVTDPTTKARFRLGTSNTQPESGGALTQTVRDDTATKLSITTGSVDNYLVVFCYTSGSTTTLEEILDSLVITSGSSTYAEMCKIGNYQDYLHKDSGKWYVHKEIGKVVLDENTTFEGYQSFGNYYRGQKKIQDAKIFGNNNIEIFSNNFKGNINVFTSTKAEVGNMGQYKNTIDFYFISTQPTQADFKTWLSTHNTIIYYILATPTEEEITNTTLIEQLEAIANAKSVKDKTYITQTNDDLPFILDVEAIKEYSVE